MNRIIFITGATSGIGRACADIFAKAKDNLIITGRRNERLLQIKDELEKKYAIQVLPLCFDVRIRKDVEDAIKSIPEKWQRINILINNAGLALGRSTIDEGDLNDWETMMQTNVNGLLYVSRNILPLMKKITGAHIVNIGSIAGKEVYESGNVYCASKFAVDALSRAMRIDLLPHGIKVTAIHPGAVETEFSTVRYKGDLLKANATYKGLVPLTAADVANSIFYCCSLPPHVCINELVLTCVRQAGTYYFHKNV